MRAPKTQQKGEIMKCFVFCLACLAIAACGTEPLENPIEKQDAAALRRVEEIDSPPSSSGGGSGGVSTGDSAVNSESSSASGASSEAASASSSDTSVEVINNIDITVVVESDDTPDDSCCGECCECGETAPESEDLDPPECDDNDDCDDGDACNGPERCVVGMCLSALYNLDCDDDIGCTHDWCDSTVGCKHAAVRSVCSETEYCESWSAVPGTLGCHSSGSDEYSCSNGRDDNEDGLADCDDEACAETDYCVATGDLDGDGFSVAAGDCDDTNPAINPGTYDGCNADGVDQNCDGADQDYVCAPWLICAPSYAGWYTCQCAGDGTERRLHDRDGDGFSVAAGDCDDANPAINPGTYDGCNADGVDQNCDGADQDYVCAPWLVCAPSTAGWYTCQCAGDGTERRLHDRDGDGYGNLGDYELADVCEPWPTDGSLVPWIEGEEDCMDGNPDIHPYRVDLCNDVDDDCDGRVDEDEECAPPVPVCEETLCVSQPDTFLDGEIINAAQGEVTTNRLRLVAGEHGADVTGIETVVGHAWGFADYEHVRVFVLDDGFERVEELTLVHRENVTHQMYLYALDLEDPLEVAGYQSAWLEVVYPIRECFNPTWGGGTFQTIIQALDYTDRVTGDDYASCSQSHWDECWIYSGEFSVNWPASGCVGPMPPEDVSVHCNADDNPLSRIVTPGEKVRVINGRCLADDDDLETKDFTFCFSGSNSYAVDRVELKYGFDDTGAFISRIGYLDEDGCVEFTDASGVTIMDGETKPFTLDVYVGEGGPTGPAQSGDQFRFEFRNATFVSKTYGHEVSPVSAGMWGSYPFIVRNTQPVVGISGFTPSGITAPSFGTKFVFMVCADDPGDLSFSQVNFGLRTSDPLGSGWNTQGTLSEMIDVFDYDEPAEDIETAAYFQYDDETGVITGVQVVVDHMATYVAAGTCKDIGLRLSTLGAHPSGDDTSPIPSGGATLQVSVENLIWNDGSGDFIAGTYVPGIPCVGPELTYP
ncbi:MAG: putative metal-binding motif-containing protein [Candidatus Uhrbacteria bacterium]